MEETIEKEKDGSSVDRLSNLPESLLLHILSFLPTSTCVITITLVSHRYRYLWEHLQVLNVNEEHFHDLPISISLFVNNFLARRKSPHIHKFCLSYTFYRDEFSALYVDTWIRTAVGSQLEELHLSIFSYKVDAFNFPLNLLSSCPKLSSLSFIGNILLQTQLLLSSMVSLPSLKKLEIFLFGEVDLAFLNVILCGCPILEILRVSVSTKSLTTLSMPNSLKELKFRVASDVWPCIEIDAPGLKYLYLAGTTGTFEGNTGNLNKVDEAYLGLFSLSMDPLHNLLQMLSGIKCLVLGSLKNKKLWQFDVEFPEFRHLTHLGLILPCFNHSFLYQMLQKCPMLQALKIEKHKDPLPPLYDWVPEPKSVPKCLVSHLRFIRYKRFQANLDELIFTGYLLQKGLVLETMHISCFSKVKWEKDGILRQFLNRPRGSVSCKLELD